MDGNAEYLPEITESNVIMVVNDETQRAAGGAAARPEEVVDEQVEDPVEEKQEQEEDMIEVKQRKKLEQREIFRPPKVQEVISNTTGKPKKKMSEKQLSHLAKIRAKGLATRQRNKKLREEGKAEEISKKVQKENVRIQEKIIKEKEKISLSEIENITFNAISKYETMRKARKAKKREEQAKEQKEKAHMEVVNNHLNSALRRSTGSAPDIWDSALAGLWS